MAFHWKDNWYFERLEDSSVRIYHEDLEADQEEDHVEYDVCIDIDPASWASIVASVSAKGDTAETFKRAEELHRGSRYETSCQCGDSFIGKSGVTCPACKEKGAHGPWCEHDTHK